MYSATTNSYGVLPRSFLRSLAWLQDHKKTCKCVLAWPMVFVLTALHHGVFRRAVRPLNLAIRLRMSRLGKALRYALLVAELPGRVAVHLGMAG